MVVLAVALVIFGSSRMPEAGRSLGRAVRGFKDALAEESQDSAGAELSTGPGSSAQ